MPIRSGSEPPRRDTRATGAPAEPAIIRDAGDLARYARQSLGQWLHPRREIVVELPGLADAARDRLGRRLNFWRSVCGCLPAGLVVLAVIAWRATALVQGGAYAFGSVFGEAAHLLLWGLGAKMAAVTTARLILFGEIVRLRLRHAGGAPNTGGAAS